MVIDHLVEITGVIDQIVETRDAVDQGAETDTIMMNMVIDTTDRQIIAK